MFDSLHLKMIKLFFLINVERLCLLVEFYSRVSSVYFVVVVIVVILL